MVLGTYAKSTNIVSQFSNLKDSYFRVSLSSLQFPGTSERERDREFHTMQTQKFRHSAFMMQGQT